MNTKKSEVNLKVIWFNLVMKIRDDLDRHIDTKEREVHFLRKKRFRLD